MAKMIKVPLGQGATQQLQEKMDEPIGFTNNIEFLRNLMIKRRMIIEQVDSAIGGTQINIVPANGTTFFFLKLMVSNADTTNAQTISLVNNSSARSSILERLECPPEQSIESHSPIDMVVGDGSAGFAVQMTSNLSTNMTLFGWNENTVRIA